MAGAPQWTVSAEPNFPAIPTDIWMKPSWILQTSPFTYWRPPDDLCHCHMEQKHHQVAPCPNSWPPKCETLQKVVVLNDPWKINQSLSLVLYHKISSRSFLRDGLLVFLKNFLREIMTAHILPHPVDYNASLASSVKLWTNIFINNKF